MGPRLQPSSGGAAGHARVEFIEVDHATAGANLELAERLRSRLGRLDVLVNNVGGLVPSRVTTGDGYELTLALNLVAPFVLMADGDPLATSRASGRIPHFASWPGRSYSLWCGPLPWRISIAAAG